MAAGGFYTIGGSFWEFGEPDWERTRYFMLFGCAEDHDSNPLKIALGELKARGVKIVSVNPVRTGYSAIADEWLGIRPGTDGLLVLALVHELLRAGKIDVDYLIRYTNAPWLVIQDPGADEDGLFARDEAGRPLVWDRVQKAPRAAFDPDVRPALKGEVTLPDGRRAKPVFHLLAERYLADEYSPEAVAPRTGIPAATIRRIAAELAHAAFEQAIALDVPWTDAWGGGTRRRSDARSACTRCAASRRTPTAFTPAARCICCRSCSARSMYRAVFATSRRIPSRSRPDPGPRARSARSCPARPLPRPPLGFPTGPEDLLVEADGTPRRIDKAFSWEAPLAAHGMLHLVITNAHNGDPYPIDTLFMYMANMAWNSAMNTAGTIAMLTAKHPASGEYRIPRIIYSDAYFSEMVAYADLILPDTTYLERWDCISLLDRPISSPDGPADAIRQPVLPPDRDVRPFQDVLLDLGARLALPGLVNPDGSARFPKGYADYLVHHERRPGIGLLAGWRGADGAERAAASPTPISCSATSSTAASGRTSWRRKRATTRTPIASISTRRARWASSSVPSRSRCSCTARSCRGSVWRRKVTARCSRPRLHRERVRGYFDPLPFWYAPFEAGRRRGGFPAARDHPAAGGHVPLLGLDERVAAPDPRRNRLYLHRTRAGRLGLEDDDWAWVTSRHGRIKAQVRLMDGVNPDTCWTWNAIGKRAGAWNLAPDAPEATKSFLLNHLIDELLPERDGRLSLRQCRSGDRSGRLVRSARAHRARGAGRSRAERAAIRPAAPAGRSARAAGGLEVRAGVSRTSMTSLPATRPARRLGLVIDLDTCVGCQACVVACKEWNTGGHPAPLTDQDPYGAEPRGAWLNRVHGYEVGEGADGRTVHFPKSCLHCEDAACVTVCPTGASYKRAEDGIVLVDEALCIGCGLCAWACPYGARELDADQGVMKKCTLCIDRIYNVNLAAEDRVPACVRACPTGARHFGDLADPDFGRLAPRRRARRL